jgi:Ca2+-binding RTX toxin-like protein
LLHFNHISSIFMTTPVIKTIGQVTALIPEASTADEAHELLDGQSGDIDFPYAKFKALATVGEVDPVTNKALTGYPDGNAAWLKDDNTVRVAYQSESYATMSNETYGWLMESGVKFTGSHIHYIDYDRAKFADFLGNEAPASDMFIASGHLFDKVYNVFGKEVAVKTANKLDLAGKWGNQTNPDGTIVEFLPARQLTEGDFFFHSFCGAWYEPANKYGAGIGFTDDIWLMGEEWNIGPSMFADPDGAGPLTGFDVANGTMGLASMVVDIKNEVAYTVPALGQAGYEKLMPINSGHEDFVVIVASGYNHDINPAPLKVYVGRKGYDAAGNPINLDDPNLSERDRFLGSNGLLYGQLYGMAADAATYAELGITTVDADTKMLDDYLKNASAPDQFSARYIATDYRWDGFDSPEAVKDTEALRWAKDGDVVGDTVEANKQPTGYTFFNSDTKVEHPAVDPEGGFRYIQNHTRTGAILGIEFTNMVGDLTNNDLDANGLPDYLSADVTRILAAVDGALTLDVGDKGVGHYNATGNPSGATAEQHIEFKNRKANDPDGLLWVKSSDADLLILDEDSGNDYGERKYALVINEDTLAIEPDGTGYFLAQAGGSTNPRALAGAAAYEGTFETARGSEFSGSWNVTALVATKADGAFYTQDELKGNGVQTVEQSRPLSEHRFIGVVQQAGESAGAVEATKADYGGQIFMFSLDLPGIEPKPVVGTSDADAIIQPDASKDITLIGNTIFTGAGDDEVDVALSDGFNNRIFAGSGVDTIYAGSRDVITGGSGDDWFSAEAGDGNRLSGGLGNDSFIIGSATNRALGDAGDDKFYVLGGAGTNYLNGGAGADQFWLISEIGDRPAAKQFVMDFKAGEDKVGLQGVAFSSLSFTQVGGDTLLKVAGVEVGHFTNLSAASLNSQANFAGLA